MPHPLTPLVALGVVYMAQNELPDGRVFHRHAVRAKRGRESKDTSPRYRITPPIDTAGLPPR